MRVEPAWRSWEFQLALFTLAAIAYTVMLTFSPPSRLYGGVFLVSAVAVVVATKAVFVVVRRRAGAVAVYPDDWSARDLEAFRRCRTAAGIVTLIVWPIVIWAAAWHLEEMFPGPHSRLTMFVFPLILVMLWLDTLTPRDWRTRSRTGSNYFDQLPYTIGLVAIVALTEPVLLIVEP